MKKSIFLAILAILAAGLVLLRLSDSVVSIADADTPNNEVTASTTNSSARATITITMYAVGDE